jgi:hypothetical protein
MDYGAQNVLVSFSVWNLYDNTGQSNSACVVARSINPESGYNERILLPREQAADVVTALNELPALQDRVEFFYELNRARSGPKGTYQIETEPLPGDQAVDLRNKLNAQNITLPQYLVFPSQER